jgi:hypothetical protein
LENFKTALSGMDWSHVTDINSVDDAYASFWTSYMELYELFFPKKRLDLTKTFTKLHPS